MNGWITKREPVEHNRYLVTLPPLVVTDRNYVEIAAFWLNDGWHDIVTDKPIKPLAWQSLPFAYEAEGSAE
jgi:hypothetical protein